MFETKVMRIYIRHDLTCDTTGFVPVEVILKMSFPDQNETGGNLIISASGEIVIDLHVRSDATLVEIEQLALGLVK
ncbi:hypothetical protein [Pararhodobacter oceanensis]|uniref:hypothetical protein n=1 Tax=Pararhodobacter oceanensis TaxID=2172121 RepID=UPI000E30A2ED|nr:hypothetical protein [Pararhodobacter oceanensis]